MAGSKTNLWETDILKAVTGQTPTLTSILTPLAHVWMGLATAASNPEAGTFTEVSASGTAYARVDSLGKWAAPSSASDPSSVATNADIQWAIATADWGTVTHWFISDASTVGGGNILYWSDLLDASLVTTTKVVANGDRFTIPSGNAVITEK